MTFKNYRVRQDSNQAEIVNQINAVPTLDALDLSGVGDGCTDIMIQQRLPYETKLYLVEIKTEKGKLNKKQRDFHAIFDCHIARNIEDIWNILGLGV